MLAGLFLSGWDKALFEEDMEEMAMLCRTAGAEVVDRVVQRRPSVVASTYLGKGKLKEIAATMRAEDCNTVVIDAELSPAQVRNIEGIVKGKVIDRSQLILDIFAHHATTREARIQVELAQLRTLYPRLTHAWTHFSKQVGGIGTSGPGEKQLEVDRRLVQRRITELKRKLKGVERTRTTQRRARENVFRVALVGYTNVGKSSLLNALCGSRVHVKDELFATLDTATRRTYIPGAGNIVISDTVGFLRKLPHHLVASFKSTLEVALDSDLLLVVLDASNPWTPQRLRTVHEVLDSLGADGRTQLLVLNKFDLVTDGFARKKLQIAHPDAVFVSARTRRGIPELRERIAGVIAERDKERERQRIIKEKTRSSARTDPLLPEAALLEHEQYPGR